jgi:hypothetical protein
MAQELTDIVETTFIPAKNAIHDCVDTGATLALTASSEIDFPVDCVQRDYKSTTTVLWDGVNSIVKDTIDNTEIRVKIKLTLNGSINDILLIKCFVPHPTFGDILIDEQDLVLYKNNEDKPFTRFFMLYNGADSEAKTYGFKFTITPNGNMDLKARSILVSV